MTSKLNLRSAKKNKPVVPPPSSSSSSSEADSDYTSCSDEEEGEATSGSEYVGTSVSASTVASASPKSAARRGPTKPSSREERDFKKFMASMLNASKLMKTAEDATKRVAKRKKTKRETIRSQDESADDEEADESADDDADESADDEEADESADDEEESVAKKPKTKRHRRATGDADADDEESAAKKPKTKRHRKSEEDDEPVKQFNIVYSLVDEDEDDDDDDEFCGDYLGAEEDAEVLRDDEDEECDSADEKMFMSENYEQIEVPIIESPAAKKNNKKNRATEKAGAGSCAEEDAPEPKDVAQQYADLIDLKKMLVLQSKKNPANKGLKSSLDECAENIKNLVLESRHANTKEYHSLVHTELSRTNELEYFKKHLSNQEQQSIMRDLKIINADIYNDKPQRLAILQSSMSTKYKAVAMLRMNKLQAMDATDNEYHKLKHWVDNFMRIPFGIYRSIRVSMADGKEHCTEFMVDAKDTLDKCVYGLNDAKMQIMQMLGQWVVNPGSVGTAIAIHGPPGTGKTSIVKDGISKILGREFAFIALGGCGDSSFLEGHSYTYEGSLWGKIVQILMDCKCMNPVIYFDELDKLSDSARGQEIVGILTHLTDLAQNSEFHDKFFSDVSFDLSKCLFIFSYNDESMVNPILKDRMYRIQTKGYDCKDKVVIARNYLLPKIREQVCFGESEIVIPDDTLNYIINSDHLTHHESGVRNLKRCLEIIYTKLNLFRLIDTDATNILDSGADFKGVKVQFPYTVGRKDVDRFISHKDPINPTLLSMYI